MSPLYNDGEIVEVDPNAYQKAEIAINDIVLLEHPYIENYLLIKKITAIDKEKVFIAGINKKSSTDSRHFGMIAKDKIIGKVIQPQK